MAIEIRELGYNPGYTIEHSHSVVGNVADAIENIDNKSGLPDGSEAGQIPFKEALSEKTDLRKRPIRRVNQLFVDPDQQIGRKLLYALPRSYHFISRRVHNLAQSLNRLLSVE